MPLLVQFGAGNIGRSLIAQLFAAAGWHVVFLDVNPVLIDALNQNRRYQITVKDAPLPGQPTSIVVPNVSGINTATHPDDAVNAIAQADIVGTSVGAANLPGACRTIAAALPARSDPLPVLLCENLHNAAAFARRHLLDASSPDIAGKAHFIEAAISKMVPATPPDVARLDPLASYAEAYNTLYLDADSYPGVPPSIPGVAWRSNFPAYVDRKLLLHNFGHAACAYHGSLHGAVYIWQCMDIPEVAEETQNCMMETARALAVRHPGSFTFDENRAWADDLLRRFRNQYLNDPVARVGRDLKRKLAPGDRLVGALRLLQETGIQPVHTARAVAAALLFSPRDDSVPPLDSDAGIVGQARVDGPESVLTGVCRLDAGKDAEPIARICREYRSLAGKSS